MRFWRLLTAVGLVLAAAMAPACENENLCLADKAWATPVSQPLIDLCADEIPGLCVAPCCGSPMPDRHIESPASLDHPILPRLPLLPCLDRAALPKKTCRLVSHLLRAPPGRSPPLS